MAKDVLPQVKVRPSVYFLRPMNLSAVLYQLIRQSNSIVDREFEIEFLDSGVEAYSFSFG